MKKLLLCIAVSVAITTFIGMAVGLVNYQIHKYSILNSSEGIENTVKELAHDSIQSIKNEELLREEKEKHSVQPNEADFSDPTEEDFNRFHTEEHNENNKITADDYAKYGQQALEESTKNMILGMFLLSNDVFVIYFQSAVIGILIGTLVYLIFIKKIKSKKIVLISLLCFTILFIVIHAGDILTDISYSIKEKTWGIELYNYINLDDTLTLLFIAYSIIFIVIYTVNLLHQKKIAKKLNNELDKTK